MDKTNTQNIIDGILMYFSQKLSLKEQNDIINILHQKRKPENKIIITSAIPLDENQKKILIVFLTKKYNSTDNIKFQIDKNIIAGLKIEINDYLIDKTFLGYLNKIQGEIYD